ncbi:hypothetical protein BUALT_Bualt01G0138500 [Buddleja alternifolia]|uniref:F-box protein n=1 Tax=Buddleja alternifolia TaxID=168488 RepID=A0AAV6YER3_9LAMI|nr:hypothetical protein BUALT_Bualt01G0138500 [Buddleja alternifolia]
METTTVVDDDVPTSLLLSFGDFPEDVQICVLSFLRPSELAAFASTCKRFLSICRHDHHRLWFSMCHRRWGSKTLINKWRANAKISYKQLYTILHQYQNLIGFWRRSGDTSTSSPPLLFFEWGPFYITGSRILPSRNRGGGYEVIKKPFLWMSIALNGEPVNYLDLDGRFSFTDEDWIGMNLDSDLIRVNVSFMGECHMVVEESLGLSSSEDYDLYVSPPDKLMTQIYQHFANRTSPSGNGASRRQRRKEKAKQGRVRKWDSEYFVKIVNCSPKPARPLQGLWKGICDDMSLDFYLVSYDDVGGIACRKFGDSNRPLTYHAPIFWATSSTFVESPFSSEEDYIYNCRLHLRPEDHLLSSSDNETVSRMLYINSSNDLVIPDITINPQQVEGRIWQYGNGTFGYGFLRDNYIIDMKHIAENGELLDVIGPCND